MRRDAIPTHPPPPNKAFNITHYHNIQVDRALLKKQPLYYIQLTLAEAHIHDLSKSHQPPSNSWA